MPQLPNALSFGTALALSVSALLGYRPVWADQLPQDQAPTAALRIETARAAPAPASPGHEQSTQYPYWDDRSGGEELVQSYFNAINRKEYARAYAYWQPNTPADQLAPFPDFRQGYAETASVQVMVGTVGGDVGAGQLYFSVPVALVAETTDGTVQAFAGCYTLHLSQPAIQGVPPFHPLSIQSASVQEVDPAADLDAVLAQACEQSGALPGPPLNSATPADPTSIDASRYLDDRSSADEVVRSYFNAINRHEYVRAYSYWRPLAAAQQLPAYPDFEQGYADTRSVQLTVGTVQTDAGAGQINYTVPITLEAETTSGEGQFFAGCYQLHLTQPLLQEEPPYEGITIQSASIHEATADELAAGPDSQSCQ